MKNISLLGILFITITLLLSCANPHNMTLPVNRMPVIETWMNHVNTNPSQWLHRADSWFLTGSSNLLEARLRKAPASAAIITTEKPLPNITDIIIQGSFQVQIIGGQTESSVRVLGSKLMTDQLSIKTVGKKLFILQTGEGQLDNIIVRINVCDLHFLSNTGTSLVMGRDIKSTHLIIENQGSGSVYLIGTMNLSQLIQTSSGVVTLIGAITPQLTIDAAGSGNVNISGRVGIQRIRQKGNGHINIIGADSNELCINAAGNGIIAITGPVNVKEIIASRCSRIWITCARSNHLTVFATGDSKVGIAGKAKTIDVKTQNKACFLGEYLLTHKAYIKTIHSSHANAQVNQRIFAEALHKSSIYYFGSEKNLNSYYSGEAKVIVLRAPPVKPLGYQECCFKML